MSLDDLIDDCRVQSKHKVGVPTPAHVRLANALLADSDLHREAKAMLAAIHPSVLDRDHESRWLKALLEGALP